MGKGKKKANKSPADSKAKLKTQSTLLLIESLQKKCYAGTCKLDLPSFEDIWSTLQKLQESQGSCYLDSLPSRRDCLPSFLQWLRENRVECDGLSIEEMPGRGWGMVSKKDFSKGDLLVSVPLDLMILASDAQKGPLGKIQIPEIHHVFQNMPHVLLALHLMNELLTKDSKWRPYIEMLPRAYSLPLYFTPEDMKGLVGSPSLTECINQVRTIGSLYSNLFKLSRTYSDEHILQLPLIKEGFKYKEFCWAVSTVMSRQNQVVVGDQEKVPVLIPMWDMCNHTNGHITTGYEPDKERCQCFSQRNIKSGEEVLIFYGPRTNLEFLCYSGFVYPENNHDVLPVKLGLSMSEDRTMSEMRKTLLTLVGTACSGMFHLQPGPEPFASNILAFVRVFVSDEQELRELSSKPESELQKILTTPAGCVSEANETRMYQFLATRCSLLLRSFQTSIEQDDVLLADPALSPCSRQAIQLRRCEKVLLTRSRDTATERSKT